MMALLNWLLKRESNKESVLTEDAPPAKGNKPATRREIRAERRNLLFTVITDAMNMIGLEASSYKFKVLTLDGDGHQHLVMMDMARELMRDTGRLEEIEYQVIQQAKQKHNLVVTSMYFRVNESLVSRIKTPPPRPRTARSPARPTRPLRPLRSNTGVDDSASTAFPPTAVALPHQSVMPSNESSAVGKGRSLLQTLKISSGSLAASWRNRRAETKKSERNFATTRVEEEHHAAASDSKRST